MALSFFFSPSFVLELYSDTLGLEQLSLVYAGPAKYRYDRAVVRRACMIFPCLDATLKVFLYMRS